jgi:hypothetical protein
MTPKQQAKDMRHAIDMLEVALMGMGNLVELPELFEDADDGTALAMPVTVGQVRRVCTALAECTRIINSDDYVVR